MIDINDPRNQHLIAHPHFLKGIEHERERIIELIDGCPRINGQEWHVENVMTCEGRCDFDVADYQNRLIALIRGEQQ
jgi:hypothetical protein